MFYCKLLAAGLLLTYQISEPCASQDREHLSNAVLEVQRGSEITGVVFNKYRTCDHYQDAGSISILYVGKEPKQLATFSTKFERDNLFSFVVTTPVRYELSKAGNEVLFWVGGHKSTYDLGSFENLIERFDSISFGVSTFVASLLIELPFNSTAIRINSARVGVEGSWLPLDEVTLANNACYVIQQDLGGFRSKLFIAKDSFLILRFDRRYSADGPMFSFVFHSQKLSNGAG